MPTVIIPDKICSHCGGTKWFIVYEKYKTKTYTFYRCSEKVNEINRVWSAKNKDKRSLTNKKSKDKVKHTEAYKEKNKTRAKEWYRLNTERAKNNHKKTKKANPEKYKNFERKKQQEYIKTMHSVYLKELICQHSNIPRSDVPQELIELKRKQLILTRIIRNHGN